MLFHVYRKTTEDRWEYVAETRYLADAKSVLKNWTVGYVTQDGRIVAQKGKIS